MIDLEKLREQAPYVGLIDVELIELLDHIAQLEKDVDQQKGRADFWNARARVHRKARSKLVLQVRELDKDAGRYQWLKNKGRYCDWRVEQEKNGWMTTHSASTLDQAIDIAMESNHG